MSHPTTYRTNTSWHAKICKSDVGNEKNPRKVYWHNSNIWIYAKVILDPFDQLIFEQIEITENLFAIGLEMKMFT